MKSLSERYVPLVVSVGQVVIFPYYILWLKEASLTFTLFTWFFAAFSFSAAFGYRLFRAGKKHANTYIPYNIPNILHYYLWDCFINLRDWANINDSLLEGGSL